MNKNAISTNIKGMVAVILIVCTVFIVAGAFWYWATYVQSSLKEVVSLSAGSTKAAQERKLRSMRKELRDTQRGRSALEQLAITEELVPDFLNTLETLGTGTVQVFVRGVDVQAEAHLVSISLSFSGSFDEAVSTVKKVSNTQYVSYVDTLELRIGKSIEGGVEIQDVSMRLVVPLLVLEQDKE